MTEREAIQVFDGLRQTYRSINTQELGQAQNVLERTHVIPSALVQGLVSALGTLRAVFDEIDRWESRQQN